QRDMQSQDAHQVRDAGAIEEPPFLRGDGPLVADRERGEDARSRGRTELGLEAIAHGLPSFFDQVRNAIPRSNLPSLSPLPYVPRGSDAALEQPSLVVEAVRIDVPMGPAQPHREQPALARMHRLLEQRRTLLGPRRAMP